jgi:arylsulfatase A-like enzyme
MARSALLVLQSCVIAAFAKNVVFFMPDDGDLPSSTLTPNFDRIRSEGVVFNSAYAAGTSCAPSRFSVITGRYCSRATFAQADPLSAGGPTWVDSSNTCKLDGSDLVLNLAYQLQVQGGYRTIVSGKWHLARRDSSYFNYAADRGAVINAGFTDPVAIYIENLPKASTRDVTKLGFSHNMEWLTATANAAIEDAVVNAKKPFFLYFTPTAPHLPSIIQALADFSLVDTPAGTLDADPDHGHEHSRAQIIEAAGGDEYAAATIWNDDALGSLMAKMESLNVLDETLIIVTMDHGEPKYGIQQSSARVSMFARLPGLILAGSYINFPTSHLDIAPTIFEYTGVVPAEEYATDGKSWYGAVTGSNGLSTRACVVFEHFQNRAVSCDGLGLKLSFFYSTGSHELYDLAADAAEQVNLYKEAAYADVQAFIQTYLECHMISTDPSNPTECDPENLQVGIESQPQRYQPTLSPSPTSLSVPTQVEGMSFSYSFSNDPPPEQTNHLNVLPTAFLLPGPSSLPISQPSSFPVPTQLPIPAAIQSIPSRSKPILKEKQQKPGKVTLSLRVGDNS